MNKIAILFLFALGWHGSELLAQDESPLIRFGVIADIQYCNCDTHGSRYYRNSLIKLDDCVVDLNLRKVQFTVNLGDLVDRDTKANLDSILLRLDKLENRVYNTTGNHDYDGITDNHDLYKKLGMPDEYYSFVKSGWRFIVLNTNEVASYSNVKGTHKEKELDDMRKEIEDAGRKNEASYNGGISQQQLTWLQSELESAKEEKENVLLFAHHPLYAAEGLTALNDIEILRTIADYSCVKGVISGHHHSGAYGVYKGIPLITTEGMIETEDSNAYGIVDVFEDKIIFTGQGRTKSYIISVD